MPRPEERPLHLIGAACGRGSPDSRCAEGPGAIRAAGIVERLADAGREAKWVAMLDCAGTTSLDAVSELCPRLADQTFEALQQGGLPLVLTGDHSCAIGTWAGVARALRPKGTLGLLWIDAHLDSHTPQTSHTGAIHGMPLAALLGHGEPVLTQCGGDGPKLLPANVCIVGVRSYEDEEMRFLAELGVRIFYMDEVRRRGVAAVLADALELVCADTAGFGISIDLDAIDPLEAPGVGTPAARGIGGEALRLALRGSGNDSRLAGIELSEYNPARDRDGKTARLAIDLLGALFAIPVEASGAARHG